MVVAAKLKCPPSQVTVGFWFGIQESAYGGSSRITYSCIRIEGNDGWILRDELSSYRILITGIEIVEVGRAVVLLTSEFALFRATRQLIVIVGRTERRVVRDLLHTVIAVGRLRKSKCLSF